MTPDGLIKLFDGYAALLMLVWGFVHTRWPKLKWLPNAAVPWVNAIAYILAAFVVPTPAEAGVFGGITSAAGLAWRVAAGAATSALTSLLYDKYLKTFLDKYVPVPR